MKDGKKCCPCKMILSLLLAIASLLLLLVNLEVLTGGFASFVMTWWPAALLLFALGGMCSCRKACCGGKCEK